MALIAGQVLTATIGGIVNPALTPALQGFAVDYWPPSAARAASPIYGAAASGLPVSASPRAIDAQVVRSYSGDFYHRIHIRPQLVALGNAVTAQVQEIEVWNAFLSPVTLIAIDGIEEGIAVDGPDDFPLTFSGLQLLTWDVSVSENGPTTINVTLTWDFSSVPDVQLGITGTRIVAFAIAPDWARGIRERLQWKTDVLSSDERHEQRRAMRLAPRRMFDAPIIVDGRERVLYDLMLRGWGGRVWALPIWPDVQLLSAPVSQGATTIPCSTAGRDFRDGGLVLLRGESAFVSEAAEIDEVGGGGLTLRRPTQRAWPSGARVYPARTAMLAEQPRERRLSDQAITVEARFVLMEPSDWPAAVLSTYRDLPVLAARPDESENLTATYERMLRTLDNGSGVPFVLDAADAPFRVQAHAWKLGGVSERSSFRSLLYALCGRQTSVWLPTHADDLRIIEPIGASSTTMRVERVEYSRFGRDQLGCTDIRIELRDGTAFMRRITDAIVIDEDAEQLTIDAPLGQTVNPAEVFRISFMMLARQQSDEVDILHVTDVEGVATSNLLFVATRDEVSA